MKKTIFFLFVVGFFVNAYSQEPLWSSNYSINAYSSPHIVPQDDNTFMVVGTGESKLYLLTYNLSGNLISEQIFGNNEYHSVFNYEFDNLGHFYVLNKPIYPIGNNKIEIRKYELNTNDLLWVGEIQDMSYNSFTVSILEDTTIFITARNSDAIHLFAYNTEGNQLWLRTFNSSSGLISNYFQHLVYNDGIYLAGASHGSTQIKLIKVDIDNNKTLDVVINVQDINALIKGMYLSKDNKILITSMMYHGISKIDLDGNLLWSEHFTFPSEFTYTMTQSLTQDEDGNIYITGNRKDYPNPFTTYILTSKFDSEGNLLWQNSYPDGDITVSPNSITLKNGYIYVGGRELEGNSEVMTTSDYLVLKIDADTGSFVSRYKYGEPEEQYDYVSAIYAFENNIALTGQTNLQTSNNWTTQLLSESSFLVENPEYLENVKLYPNPLHENQMLTIEAEKLKSYTVYSLTGQLLQQGKFESGSVHSIQLQSLKKGVYLLKLNAEKHTLTKKIVIR
jgi:hypothetical protein